MHIVMVECNPNGIAGIANALAAGHEATLITADPDFYLAASPIAPQVYAHPRCQVIRSPESFSIEVLEGLVRQVHAARPVHGITTYSEYHTVHAATVAASLGLPGMSVTGALNARHKHRTRLALAGVEGVRQPRFAHVPDPAGVAAAVREVGFPCVVKPSDGTASLHVLQLNDERDLAGYLAELAAVRDYGRGVVRIPDILVEEFVTGELVSVESFVRGEEVVNLGVTDRTLSGFPYFVEMGATYFRGHPLEAELFEMTGRVLRALGIDSGFIHTEFILGADGPVLCEVNGRLIGGVVPALMKISSGIDPYLEVIRHALGEEPELPFPGAVTASGRWFGSPVSGVLRGVDFAEVREMDGFVEATSYKEPGTPVVRLSKSNFDWLGHVIFTGDGRDQAAKRCEAALDAIGLALAVEVAR